MRTIGPLEHDGARARAHVVFARVVRVRVPVLVFVLTYVHLLLVIARTTVL